MPSTSYPPPGFSFQVVFTFTATDFVVDASFQEISGLSAEQPVEEVVESGPFVYRVREPRRNLVLKRGLAVGAKLRVWIESAVKAFQFVPGVQATINLVDEKASSLMTWNFYNVRPIKWELSAFDAKDPENIVIEALELAYDYFDTAKG